jgi:hypothetical protein
VESIDDLHIAFERAAEPRLSQRRAERLPVLSAEVELQLERPPRERALHAPDQLR